MNTQEQASYHIYKTGGVINAPTKILVEKLISADMLREVSYTRNIAQVDRDFSNWRSTDRKGLELLAAAYNQRPGWLAGLLSDRTLEPMHILYNFSAHMALDADLHELYYKQSERYTCTLWARNQDGYDDLHCSDAMQATAATAVNTAIHNQTRPTYKELPVKYQEQLRSDGTRDGLRSADEAKELYDRLPRSINNENDVHSVVSSPDYEGGHIQPHSQGGSADADNIAYMPTELNRQIGDNIPTTEQLTTANSAVEAEGFLFENSIIDFAAGATAPIATHTAGSMAKGLGALVAGNSDGVNQAADDFVKGIPQAAEATVTRGVPAAALGAIAGPPGAIVGFAAQDFIEAFTSDDPHKQFEAAAHGSLKLGIGGACLAFPPLAIGIGAGFLAGKFIEGVCGDQLDHLRGTTHAKDMKWSEAKN